MNLEPLKHRLLNFYLLHCTGWLALTFIRTSFYLASASEHADRFIYQSLIFNGLGLLFSMALRRPYRVLRRKKPTFMISALVIFALLVACSHLWFFTSWEVITLLKLNVSQMTFSGYAAFTFSLFFDLLMWTALYFGIHYWLESERQKLMVTQIQALAREAQLQMLRYQINPHFLFNTLNSLRALISENTERAREMVTCLSDFLRYTLAHTSDQMSTIAQEVEAVENYLTIEKIRFEERLEVVYNVDDSTRNIQIPTFILHPLIENAIKYGSQSATSSVSIELRSNLSHGNLSIEVVNSGQLRSENGNTGNGIGLGNVKERLQRVYNGKQEFTLKQDGGFVRAVIRIEDIRE